MKHYILTLIFVAATMVAAAQQARWITANDAERNSTNTWIEFRKDFNLAKKPKKAETIIAADSKYWLWVNGKLTVFEGSLKRGPNRTDTYYDNIDLAPYLQKGHNDVRLLLCYFGKPGFSHINSGQSGVIFDSPSIRLCSDSSWLSQRLKAYQTCGEPYTNFRLSESNIRYNARLENQNDLRPSLEIGTWNSGAWGKLVERPIPQWRDYGIKSTSNYDTTEDTQGNTILSVRLPYNMQLTPYIDLTDPDGATTIRLETDHVWGGSAECVRAEYITKQGRQQYESLGWMNGEILRVIYPKSSNVTIHAIGYRETGYDCDFEGSFSCSDTTINRFWHKAMRTLYVNMRDNYFDCPDRERAQWWGDATILMGQSFYQLSPRANMLMHKAIHQLVDWQKDNGVIYSPIPAENWDQELPAQSLASISTYGFWYYYMHTGDTATMNYVYPAMRRYLDVWTLDEDGLTGYRDGGWPWGDWGTDVDMRLILAAWHYLALKSAVNIALLTGHTADTADYSRQMQSIRAAFNRCRNGYAYRHPSYHGATDDRVQAMAVVSGLADTSKYQRIYEVFKSQEYASPYMEKYVYEALMQMGHSDYALERFKKRFGTMIDDTLHTTLYEGWQEGGYGGGSTNHAWSGGMLTDICEQILGIRPTVAGWKEAVIEPRFSPIKEGTISIPTVNGTLKYSFKDDGEYYHATVNVPKGMKAVFIAPDGNKKELSAGVNAVEFREE
ncbi:MAG: glycoside hydrolase [Bacteroidales bacterium]|nr:glycoside hydrolase [Bacteroidales bacterium]